MRPLSELKKDAEDVALDYEINWEHLDNSATSRAVELQMQETLQMITELETLYTRLINNQSAILPSEASALTYTERENFSVLLASRLISAYTIKNIWERYTLIKNITTIGA